MDIFVNLIRLGRARAALVALLLIASAGLALAACAPGAGSRAASSAGGGLRGVVASVNVSAFSFMLAVQGGGQATQVNVSPRTEFRGDLRALTDLRPGMAVAVHGATSAHGSALDATDVDDQPDHDANDANDANDDHGGDSAHFEGTVSAVNVSGGSFTLALASGDHKTITIAAGTEFEGGLRDLASLTSGQRVSVRGTLQTDGSVAAASVEAEDAPENTPGANQGDEVALTGTIVSLDASGSSFLLAVAGGGSGTVVTNARTEFDGGFNSFSDLKTGMRVEVEGTLRSDGSALATHVHREDSGDNSGDNSGSGGDGGSDSNSGSGGSGGDSGSGGSGSHDGGHDGSVQWSGAS